jgi:hypothetical protein
MKGYYANGWMGQYLFVYPERNLIGVRMHYATTTDYGSNPPKTEYPEFPVDLLNLVGETL